MLALSVPFFKRMTKGKSKLFSLVESLHRPITNTKEASRSILNLNRLVDENNPYLGRNTTPLNCKYNKYVYYSLVTPSIYSMH